MLDPGVHAARFVRLKSDPMPNLTYMELPAGQPGALYSATRGFAVGVIAGPSPVRWEATANAVALAAVSPVLLFRAMTWSV
jgi:hypothetical protein